MTEKPEDYLSEFIESVDDMIGRHFASDAERKIRGVIESDPKNWQAVEEILYRLIRSSITHARNQVQGRKCGTMTLDEAVELARSRSVMVTRPGWNIFGGLRLQFPVQDEEVNDQNEDDGELCYWKLDNCDGGLSGCGWPYRPTDEDRTASDWILYQAPQENWVELDL